MLSVLVGSRSDHGLVVFMGDVDGGLLAYKYFSALVVVD
jgi:hypothetical protein